MHPSSRLPESPETEQDHDSLTRIHLVQVKKPLSYLQWKRANKWNYGKKNNLDLQVGLPLWQYDSKFSLQTVLMMRK